MVGLHCGLCNSKNLSIIRHLYNPFHCVIRHKFLFPLTVSMFLTLRNPTPFLFRHRISLPVQVRLDRVHCINIIHCGVPQDVCKEVSTYTGMSLYLTSRRLDIKYDMIIWYSGYKHVNKLNNSFKILLEIMLYCSKGGPYKGFIIKPLFGTYGL